ncbi:Protein of unknown function [Gryllus bimaculatus]|nr:Protein of unknown function [Gryllus bimaculatus]
MLRDALLLGLARVIIACGTRIVGAGGVRTAPGTPPSQGLRRRCCCRLPGASETSPSSVRRMRRRRWLRIEEALVDGAEPKKNLFSLARSPLPLVCPPVPSRYYHKPALPPPPPPRLPPTRLTDGHNESRCQFQTGTEAHAAATVHLAPRHDYSSTERAGLSAGAASLLAPRRCAVHLFESRLSSRRRRRWWAWWWRARGRINDGAVCLLRRRPPRALSAPAAATHGPSSSALRAVCDLFGARGTSDDVRARLVRVLELVCGTCFQFLELRLGAIRRLVLGEMVICESEGEGGNPVPPPPDPVPGPGKAGLPGVRDSTFFPPIPPPVSAGEPTPRGGGREGGERDYLWVQAVVEEGLGGRTSPALPLHLLLHYNELTQPETDCVYGVFRSYMLHSYISWSDVCPRQTCQVRLHSRPPPPWLRREGGREREERLTTLREAK